MITNPFFEYWYLTFNTVEIMAEEMFGRIAFGRSLAAVADEDYVDINSFDVDPAYTIPTRAEVLTFLQNFVNTHRDLILKAGYAALERAKEDKADANHRLACFGNALSDLEMATYPQ